MTELLNEGTRTWPVEAESDARKPGAPQVAQRSAGKRIRLFLAVIAILVLPLTLGEYGNSILLSAAIPALIVAGLHVLVHWTGQVSLSQQAFVGIGAFATATLNFRWGLPLPLAIVGGMAAASLASALVGLPALRIRGLELAITTLATGFAVDRWLFRQDWLVGEFGIAKLRDRTLLGFNVESFRELMIPAGIITLAIVLLTRRLGSSSLGRGMRMVAADEQAAASYGINCGFHKFLAFVYAGACAGLAGALYALAHSRSMGPVNFPPQLSIVYLSAVLFGGPGQVWGSVTIGAGLGMFPILLGASLGNYLNLIASINLLLIIHKFPGGLNQQFKVSSDAAKRLLRRRTRVPADGANGKKGR